MAALVDTVANGLRRRFGVLTLDQLYQNARDNYKAPICGLAKPFIERREPVPLDILVQVRRG